MSWSRALLLQADALEEWGHIVESMVEAAARAAARPSLLHSSSGPLAAQPLPSFKQQRQQQREGGEHERQQQQQQRPPRGAATVASSEDTGLASQAHRAGGSKRKTALAAGDVDAASRHHLKRGLEQGREQEQKQERGRSKRRRKGAAPSAESAEDGKEVEGAGHAAVAAEAAAAALAKEQAAAAAIKEEAAAAAAEAAADQRLLAAEPQLQRGSIVLVARMNQDRSWVEVVWITGGRVLRGRWEGVAYLPDGLTD